MCHPQQVMPMQTDNSTTDWISNNTIRGKGPTQCICGSIGYNNESARAITTCFGNQEQPTWTKILPNIINLTIIAAWDQFIYTVKITQIMKVWGWTGYRRHCTLKSQLLLVNFYFVLPQFHIKRAHFSFVFPTYVQFLTQIVVPYFLEPFQQSIVLAHLKSLAHMLSSSL